MQEQCDTAPVCGFFIREESLIPRYVALRSVAFAVGELGDAAIAPQACPAWCVSLYPFVIFGKRIMPPMNTTRTAIHAERIFIKMPPMIKPANEQPATKSAYGICVATCSKCGQAAPVEDKMVVSEMGEA